jgi:hypothetical protein
MQSFMTDFYLIWLQFFNWVQLFSSINNPHDKIVASSGSKNKFNQVNWARLHQQSSVKCKQIGCSLTVTTNWQLGFLRNQSPFSSGSAQSFISELLLIMQSFRSSFGEQFFFTQTCFNSWAFCVHWENLIYKIQKSGDHWHWDFHERFISSLSRSYKDDDANHKREKDGYHQLGSLPSVHCHGLPSISS